MAATSTIPAADALALASLVTPSERGVTSRVLVKATGGSVTAFTFAADEGLSEHSTAFEALVVVLEGVMSLVIGGTEVEAPTGTVVRMPAGVPHSLMARLDSRMLLVMLRDTPA